MTPTRMTGGFLPFLAAIVTLTVTTVVHGQEMIYLPYGPGSADLQVVDIRTPGGDVVGKVGAQVVTEHEELRVLVLTMDTTDNCVLTGDKHFRSNLDMLEMYNFDNEGDQGKKYTYAINMHEIESACKKGRDLYRITGEVSVQCNDGSGESTRNLLRRSLLEASTTDLEEVDDNDARNHRKLVLQTAKYEVGLGCESLDGYVPPPPKVPEPKAITPTGPKEEHIPIVCAGNSRRGCHDSWMHTHDDTVCVDVNVNPGIEKHCATCASKSTPVHGNAPWGFFVGQLDFKTPGKTYHFLMNAGARQFCRLSNGETSASVIVETPADEEEGLIRVWIKSACGFEMKDTQVYIGPTYLPPLPNDWYEIRPEKFPFVHPGLNHVQEDSYTIRLDQLPESDLYYIAVHSYVCRQ